MREIGRENGWEIGKKSDQVGNSNGQWRELHWRKPTNHWRQGQVPPPTQHRTQGATLNPGFKRKVDDVKRIEDSTFSVFVDNLPVDSTIERRLSISESRYRKGETGTNRDAGNNVRHGGDGRNTARMMPITAINHKKPRMNGNSYKEALLNGKNNIENGEASVDNGLRMLGNSKITLKGDEQLREMLGRCLVGETLNPVDFDTLKRQIKDDWSDVEDVRMMGAMKALVICNSKQSMEAMLEADALQKHFLETRRWTVGPLIRTWVTIEVDEEQFEIFIKEEGGLYAEADMKNDSKIEAGTLEVQKSRAVPEKD
ncbi:hypothetical protein PIB30_018953 [Stylosanthes scabra]|uniref:DUF4283 domain-containing protein n=1 Tax=Stylosanthes scabra TaxID=79078 RepID=A0ABU6Z7H9_9FABA|nr:hypothetical protein [Stylosanthes scabra]